MLLQNGHEMQPLCRKLWYVSRCFATIHKLKYFIQNVVAFLTEQGRLLGEAIDGLKSAKEILDPAR